MSTPTLKKQIEYLEKEMRFWDGHGSLPAYMLKAILATLKRHQAALNLVHAQKEHDELWSGLYVQDALHALHGVIEGQLNDD
jgi:hypothetical protein